MGPFQILAIPAPNTYRDRLDIPEHLGEDVLVPPPPVVGADGELEHEVQELLKFKMRYGRPYVLVRWAGRDASGDWAGSRWTT